MSFAQHLRGFASLVLLLGGCEQPVPPATVPAPTVTDAPVGKRSPCTTDQSCNGDPSVSALWGHCTPSTGVCSCNPGFELHPGGYCQPNTQTTEPPK